MSLTPVADVAAWLKYQAGLPTGAELTKLQATLDAAESYIAHRKGYGTTLAVRAVTQRATGRGPSLSLTTFPVISVTSVTASDGSALTVADLDVDTAAGLINYSPTMRCSFPSVFYTVVYQAGFASLDPAYTQAVREVTREFWGAQRGGSVPSGGGPPDDGSARFEADRIIATLPSYGFA